MREEELEIAMKVYAQHKWDWRQKIWRPIIASAAQNDSHIGSLLNVCCGMWSTFSLRPPLLAQIVIVGNGGVGKSSMIQRYCKGVYTNEYKKTIGVDFLERQIE